MTLISVKKLCRTVTHQTPNQIGKATGLGGGGSVQFARFKRHEVGSLND